MFRCCSLNRRLCANLFTPDHGCKPLASDAGVRHAWVCVRDFLHFSLGVCNFELHQLQVQRVLLPLVVPNLRLVQFLRRASLLLHKKSLLDNFARVDLHSNGLHVGICRRAHSQSVFCMHVGLHPLQVWRHGSDRARVCAVMVLQRSVTRILLRISVNPVFAACCQEYGSEQKGIIRGGEWKLQDRLSEGKNFFVTDIWLRALNIFLCERNVWSSTWTIPY